jgi:predicted anti-sigma-YlaC factor YlaD
MNFANENSGMSGRNEVHARAKQLIDQHHVEGLSEKERAWLDAHLQECAECATVAQSTESALRALRSNAVPFPSGLVSRTQFRERLRAQQLEEHAPRRLAIWAIAGVSWALGIATAPYVWQLFAWAGERLHVPKLAWELGFGLWWLIPALIAGAILLAESPRQKFGSGWSSR